MKYEFELEFDWDTPINEPHLNEKGRFCGRDYEISTIKNYILRRESSSILLIGHRGVGKTSLMRKVIHEAKSTDWKPKTILPVFINGPQFIDKENGNIEASSLLKVLITRLYRTLDFYNKNKDIDSLSEETGELYKKAAASIYKDISESLNQKSQSNEVTKTSMLSLTIQDVVKFILLISVSLIMIFISLTSNVDFFEAWHRLVLSIAAISIPGFISYKSIYKKESKAEGLAKEKAQQYYFFDNDISNLEFDLEKLHEKFSQRNIQIIYIIDELDKVTHKVFTDVVHKFKNLFTLGYANFIFITSEEVKKDLSRMGDTSRKVDYTYFNVNFFISRPLISDLNNFLPTIIKESKPSSKTVKTSFFNHLLFKSKGDYFDLIRTIQNHINGYNDKIPLISFDDEYSNKIRISSQLQKSIQLIFEEKYMSLHKEKWSQNESILHAMYNLAHIILDAPLSGKVIDFEANEPYLNFSAKRDLALFLYRVNYLSFSQEHDVTVINNQFNHKIKGTTYLSTNDFSQDVPTKLNFLSQWEEELISEVDNILLSIAKVTTILNALDADLNLPTDPLEIISNKNITEPTSLFTKLTSFGLNLDPLKNILAIYETLMTDIPKTYQHDAIEIQKKNLKAEEAKIINHIHSVISNSFLKKLSTLKPNGVHSQINDRNHTQVIPNRLDPNFLQRVTKQSNFVLTDRAKNKILIIVNPTEDDVFKGIKELALKGDNNYECKVISLKKSGCRKIIDIPFGSNIDSKPVESIFEKIRSWYLTEE